MNLKSCNLIFWIFIHLSVCHCKKEEEDLVEEEQLKETEEEVDLVVAAIYKVGTL